MRPTAASVGLVLAGLLLSASSARAAEWHSEQPVAAGVGVPAPIGPVGDIECWQANRCLAITQGNDALPAGLYAYDGTGWRLYSTVCGGHEGRIAWAGPDEFWTISDQRVGQEGGEGSLLNRSLCHFKDGQVVASYAEPLGQPTSYMRMDAAACSGPDDCWFAGERLPGTTNTGAFHLHWDGQALTAVPSLHDPQPELEDPARTVEGLAFQEGRLYESVQAQGDDDVPGEQASAPSLLHRVPAAGQGPFEALLSEAPLDIGGPCVQPWQLGAFHLAPSAEGLWGVAGGSGARPETTAKCPIPSAAKVTAVRVGAGGEYAQVPLVDPDGVFKADDRVNGLAVEPGGGYLWVAFRHAAEAGSTHVARLARIHADGSVDGEVQLPLAIEGMARKGSAGPVTCPEAEQCWMATEKGWLFHLGGSPPQDSDPAMHTLITYRPPDDGVPVVPPDELPADDSGAEPPPAEEEARPPREKGPGRRRARALVTRVHQRMLGRTLLQLTFTLQAGARVRLLARRRGRLVASTPTDIMERGRRSLRLRLDPKRWPTALDLDARAIRQAVGDRVALGTPPPSPTPTPPAGPAPPPPSAGSPAGEAAGNGTVAQLETGAPAMTLIGSSPAEAPGEAWGSTARAIFRYAEGGEWQQQPAPLDAGGRPLSNLSFVQGASAGRATPAGGVALLAGSEGQRLLVLRDPRGDFRAAPDPGPLLHSGEALYSSAAGSQLLSAVEEAGGRTGVFLVPVAEGVPEAVLHFDGASWSREPICAGVGSGPCQAPRPGFKVLGIDASGPGGAWLLARGAVAGDGVELFERRAGGEWRQQPLGGPLGQMFSRASAELSPGVKVGVTPRALGQPLTVTPAGAWVDAQLTFGSERSDATFYYSFEKAEVMHSWCDLAAAAAVICSSALGSELPSGEGRSFAWAGGGPGDFGRRTITGVGEQGAILVLEGDAFTRLATVGGETGASMGAALDGPEQGWLGSPRGPVHLTSNPTPSRLLSWPVPFRRPLLAIAPQPGAPAGALSSQALAVGDDGEVARYVPGQGWEAESLLTASGARATPRLRGVAWPEPDRAYAVGDHGEMWLWRGATGLWEPDPAKPPNLIRGNFTGIAFDPGDPSRGYAVGKQGLLLGYGRSWTQEPLPSGVDPEANFTSIAFAGNEALATYKMPFLDSGNNLRYTGGLLVNDGDGWHIDQQASSMLLAESEAPERVAGLPDGGAVVASGVGKVIEREGPGAPWTEVGGAPLGYPAAVAAIREAGQIRAVVSAEGLDGDLRSDSDQADNRPPAGQPPLITDPYPLPHGGLVWRQTANGWRGEEHPVYPLPAEVAGQKSFDLPLRLDPVLALLVSPDGGSGWAVGGETGGLGTGASDSTQVRAVQTAAAMRYPADAAAPGAGSAPIAASPGKAMLAIGGDDQCAGPCADLAGTGIGPDVWLPASVARARSIAGVRAFVDTGPGVAEGPNEGFGSSGRLGATLSPDAFALEERAYARRLGQSAGSLPVFAAPAATDLDRKGSLATFGSAFASVSPVDGSELSRGYYAFDSNGEGGTVRVIVLDYSLPSLGAGQSCWLAQQLAGARQEGAPAVVVGDRDLSAAGGSPNLAADWGDVVPMLVTGAPPEGCALPGPPAGASAYFFDYPEENRTYQLAASGRSIPAFGSGTLGNVLTRSESDFVGAAGFLLASIGERDPVTNVAPVTVRLIPNIEDLALDATDGTLLRRGKPALFQALARRPRAGMRCSGNSAPTRCEGLASDPYVPIPSECRGSRCSSALLPEYRFSSSNPDIADFVEVDPASGNPRAVFLSKSGETVPDPRSGLLCAFNSGSTTVTIEAGGLAYSEKVTVRAGSAQRPCGTVPLRNPPSHAVQPAVSPPPAPAPGPAFASGPTPLPPPPPPPSPPAPAPQPTPSPPPGHPLIPPFATPSPALAPVIAIVPPPPPPAAQTTPPSGTSPVTQPVTAPESEEDQEAALDLVHHAAAQRPLAFGVPAQHLAGGESGPLPGPWLPALAVLFALGAAAGLKAGRRRDLALARASSTSRRSAR
jgi:hypothetical protein